MDWYCCLRPEGKGGSNLEDTAQKNAGILCWSLHHQCDVWHICWYTFSSSNWLKSFILGWCCLLRMQYLIQPLRHMFLHHSGQTVTSFRYFSNLRFTFVLLQPRKKNTRTLSGASICPSEICHEKFIISQRGDYAVDFVDCVPSPHTSAWIMCSTSLICWGRLWSAEGDNFPGMLKLCVIRHHPDTRRPFHSYSY